MRFESATDPLPHVCPPPAPQQSLLVRLCRSSYHFPNASSFPRMSTTDFNDNLADLSNGADFNLETKVVGDERSSSGQPKLRPNERKSVRFNVDVTVYHLPTVPRASGMSSEEKRTAWYTSNEFDRFKYEAAENAGVKIVRCDNDQNRQSDQSHRFAMMGDFDRRIKKAEACGASSATEKLQYYNENEYDDVRHDDDDDENGEAICRRGLGHHFSRCRRRARAAARSAVMTRQATLLAKKLANRSGARGGDGPGEVERRRWMLALVSAKCSRIARKEAEWRGDVDYSVAYPERHVSNAKSSSPSVRLQNKRELDHPRCIMSKSGVAMVYNAATTHDAIGKRQKTSSGGCRVNMEDGLSPNPIVCISGVFRAEVL